jgi:hypothetical protein
VVTGATDGSVRIWDASAGRQVFLFVFRFRSLLLVLLVPVCVSLFVFQFVLGSGHCQRRVSPNLEKHATNQYGNLG